MFLSVTIDFYTSVDINHLVGMPVDSTPKCSFIVILGSTELISLTNGFWVSKKINSAYGVSLNLNFASRFIAVFGGGYLFWTV